MTKENNKITLVLYWIIAYIYLLPFYIIEKLGIIRISELNYWIILSINASYLLTLLTTAYFINKRNTKQKLNEALGLKTNNAKNSIIYAGLAMIPSAIMYATALYLLQIKALTNIEQLVAQSTPKFITREFPKPITPIIALLHWTVSGITSFALLQAYPYEQAEKTLGPRKAYITTLILFTGIYNGLIYTLTLGMPLQVSTLGEIIDIIILGTVYLLIYRNTRNTIGLILAYIIIYEAPIKAAIYYGWGTQALIISMIISITWQITSLLIILKRKIRKKS